MDSISQSNYKRVRSASSGGCKKRSILFSHIFMFIVPAPWQIACILGGLRFIRAYRDQTAASAGGVLGYNYRLQISSYCLSFPSPDGFLRLGKSSLRFVSRGSWSRRPRGETER